MATTDQIKEKPKVSKEQQVSFRRIQHCAMILLSENIMQVTMINM